jgi:histidinol phosphatase-like PHP family hydrolase
MVKTGTCKDAKEAGAAFVISSDAHSVEELDLIRYGATWRDAAGSPPRMS